MCHRPLCLWVEGSAYETLDWSASGARINAARTALAVGDFFAGTIEAIGSEGPGQFTAEVVRRDAAGEIGFRFIEVSALTLLAMQGLEAS